MATLRIPPFFYGCFLLCGQIITNKCTVGAKKGCKKKLANSIYDINMNKVKQKKNIEKKKLKFKCKKITSKEPQKSDYFDANVNGFGYFGMRQTKMTDAFFAVKLKFNKCFRHKNNNNKIGKKSIEREPNTKIKTKQNKMLKKKKRHEMFR